MTLRHDIQQLWDAYLHAYRTGDGAGCAAVFAPDALMTSPYGPPARGRAAIAAAHAEWTDGGSPSKQLEIVEFGGSGDTAWCLARYGEGAATGDGLSLSVLERQPDGGWLIRVCSLNEGVPPPG